MNNINYIFCAIAVLSFAFGLFNYFKKPQEDLEKKQAVDDKSVKDKAHLLAEQFEWQKENNERRFVEITKSISDTHIMAINCIHTIDVKVDELAHEVSEMNREMSKELTRLGTIIEERFKK